MDHEHTVRAFFGAVEVASLLLPDGWFGGRAMEVDEFEPSRTVSHEQALGCIRAFVADGTLGLG